MNKTIAPACMGGWCRKRDNCISYRSVSRVYVVERICPKGQDKPLAERPLPGSSVWSKAA